MEQHGKNPRQFIIAVIPARLQSTRLPNKLLLDLGGKPLILQTLEQAKKARGIDRVIVATDSEEVLKVVAESGNEAVLTSPAHQSGSDRIAEVAEKLPENSIIVNVQGDEPLIPPNTIEKAVAAILNDEAAEIATTCEPICEIVDVLSPDVVKVVTDENGFALYFSRSPIPFLREAVKKYGSLESALTNEPQLVSLYRKHTGLYVYRREYLLKFTKLAQTNLETTEMLEQLRALENGARIKVVEVAESSIGVDTREDYERARAIFARRNTISENFTFRAATIEDIKPVAAVQVASWRESFRGVAPQKFLDEMSVADRETVFRERFSHADYRMFVAENADGKIVGFVDFGQPRDENLDFERELFAIFIAAECQGKGVGNRLFKIGVDDLKARGYKSFYLQALEISPFRAFYDKLGGAVVGRHSFEMAGEDFASVFYSWRDLEKI